MLRQVAAMGYMKFKIFLSELNLNCLVDFSDKLVLAMALPNIIGLLVSASEVKNELKIFNLDKNAKS